MTFKQKALISLLDLIKGINVKNKYSSYYKSTKYSVDYIKVIQAEKLKDLLEYSCHKTKYYTNSTNKLNVSHNNAFQKLKEFPIITRDIFQSQSELFISNEYRRENLFRGSSSGTTGTPLVYYYDKNALSAGVAAAYTLWGMSGWRLGQRNVHIWGNELSIERWNTIASRAKNFLISQKNIAATLLNEPGNFENVVKKIVQFNPESIEGYSSSIYELAKYFKENNLILPGLKMVLTTAENLEEYQKDLIEEVFAPTGDLYGSGEVMSIATRPAGDDKYYVFDPHVIVETVDSGITGMKDILLTDLDNYAMPLIRYKIGDMIDELHEPEPDAKYPFTWFTKLHGRSSDIITLPNGKKFHPVNIFGGTLFRKFKGITRHKTRWDSQKLEFVFEVNSSEFKEKEDLQAALQRLLESYQCKFIMTFTDKIKPSASGKYKYLEIIKPQKQE
jgi:phenylacetate-CoA ligase